MQATPGAYARSRVRDLDRAIVQALNRARALDYQLPRARICELIAALADDLRQVRLLAAEFEPAPAGGAADLVHDLGHRLHVDLIADLGHLAGARAVADRLAGYLDLFRSLADEFVEALWRADTHRATPGRPASTTPIAAACTPAVAPARMATGLVAQAVRALPAAHRARWREEFDAELEELAEAAASRWSQIGHASRVTGRVWSLRRALLARSPAEGRV